MNIMQIKILLFFSTLLGGNYLGSLVAAKAIDRKALVERNSPVITSVDTLSSLSVGNGHFAVTADITGLQTFPEYYRNGIPLGTQSEWGWHSFDNPNQYRLEETYKMFDFGHGHRELYATETSQKGRAKDAANWFRSNPHRLHLGCIGLEMEGLKPTEIKNARQKLNLWEGVITSQFILRGAFYKISTVCHPERDMISGRIETNKSNAISLNIRFAYPTSGHSDDACDWNQNARHFTTLVSQTDKGAVLKRTLDNTIYYVILSWEGTAKLKEKAKNYWVLESPDKLLAYCCTYVKQPVSTPNPSYQATVSESKKHWQHFWSDGAAVDFSLCKDKRAKELERRVVLSQYLLAIQCAGNTPPQETGLTCNSWFGKFHLEMIWWHQAWLPLWGHDNMLAHTLEWYKTAELKAREIAMRQGFKGIRWMKMTAPNGEESPSKIGSFLIWQQPHLIYLAELLYRSQLSQEILEHYGKLVDETATFMADFATYNKENNRYILKGYIPVQETLRAETTCNSPFELAYWNFALQVAQSWRERRGLPRVAEWDDIIQKLSPLAYDKEMHYLAAESVSDGYSDIRCISDHPAVLGSVGVLPVSRLVDPNIMRHTLEWIWDNWNWDKTWGWDYPMVAMNATRMGCPEKAVDALLMPQRTNTYLPNGHNYQDQRLHCYLPGNGGLLTAIALMCAGWDGCAEKNPGFPKNGKWNVRWEGLKPLPGNINTEIRPGERWPDTNGQHIQAHGGGIQRIGNTWYWYGEDRRKGIEQDTLYRYVSCYSSKDLTNWKFEGDVIKLSKPDPILTDSVPGKLWVLERPKVYYNRKTKQHVMYMHIDGTRQGTTKGYNYAHVGVAVSKSPTGPFKLKRVFQPLGKESRDIGQFIDDDGTAYLIFECRPDSGFYIAKLSDDYLDVKEATCFVKTRLEGGAIVHYKGLYYCIGSGLTAWRPNPNKYATAKSLKGPWSEFKDIAPAESCTYMSQSSMLIKVEGTQDTTVIFTADQWRPKEQWESRYLWMPLEIGDGKLWVPEPCPWSINVKKGTYQIKKNTK